MLLGGNNPVQSHSSSQPFSSLYLHTEPKGGDLSETIQEDPGKVGSCVTGTGCRYLLWFLRNSCVHILSMVFRELFKDLTEDLIF